MNTNNLLKLYCLLTAICCVICNPLYPQSFNDRAFGEHQQLIQRNGMKVLGGWAAANILYSAVSMGKATGSSRSFHRMNIGWGGINLGLATLGYLNARKEGTTGLGNLLRKQQSLEKTFLFNAGLDLAYISTGFYLKERARRNDSQRDRNEGFGNSLILQGAGLLLFDGVMYLVHRAHGKALLIAADRLQVHTGAQGVSLSLHW